MSTLSFQSSLSLSAGQVDEMNSVLRGVSVVSGGVVARGHGLTVDQTTLNQMQSCAEAKGTVPVRLDHRSGAASVVGYLTNFRQADFKLKADLFLLETHVNRAQILEVARRMPQGMGLSASFVTPDDAEAGKARCAELLSVDIVNLPAANPDGFFEARTGAKQPISGLEKVRRAVGAAGRGAEIGAVGGLAARALLRRRNITSDGAAGIGAGIGALASGAVQWRRDSKRDLAARVTQRLFEDRNALHRLTDAGRRNIDVPIPGADEVNTVATVAGYAKKPLVRRVAVRLLKVGIGAGLGYAAGKRVGARSGAVAGAVAGALFDSPEVRNTVRLAILHANNVTNL